MAKAPKPPSPELELPGFMVKRSGPGPRGYAVVDRFSGLQVGPLMTALQARDTAHELDRNRRIEIRVEIRLDAERRERVECFIASTSPEERTLAV